MRGARRSIVRAASGACAGLEWAGAAALAFLVVLTVVDVVGRYALSAPAPGATELTEFGVAALVFAALPAVTWRGGHVAVDLLDRFVPPARRRWRAALVNAPACGRPPGGWPSWRNGRARAGRCPNIFRFPWRRPIPSSPPCAPSPAAWRCCAPP